jgi:NAD(P)-dependent dehydrogenase (short-subunit alcohol dehydrogenase family)
MDLNETVTLITGAGSGNGRGIAIGMAEAGSRMVVTDVNAQTAEETAEMIRAAGGQAIAAEVDVTSRDSVDAMVAAAMKEFGQIDTLINNAGVANRDPFLEVSEAEFDRVYSVNVKGPLLCTQAVAPVMILAGRGGSIINVASTSTELVSKNMGAYATSKGALKVLTKVMAVELGEHNIRANGICPGFTPTGLNEKKSANPELVQRELDRVVLKRVGTPQDYIGACTFLASKQSSWMTGALMFIDGGITSLAT